MHHDERIYPNPSEWDPWRFSRPREELEGMKRMAAKRDTGSSGGIRIEELEEMNALRQMAQPFVATTDTFLLFGHGKHVW